MRHVPIAVPVLLFLALALVEGCQWVQARKLAGGSPPAAKGVEVGQVAPDIDGDDFGGQRLHLADFRGKVVVLSFWSRS
jgi:cytochrome oxidase Cu insertion factor (SCO1/SenC/PrrC family)